MSRISLLIFLHGSSNNKSIYVLDTLASGLDGIIDAILACSDFIASKTYCGYFFCFSSSDSTSLIFASLLSFNIFLIWRIFSRSIKSRCCSSKSPCMVLLIVFSKSTNLIFSEILFANFSYKSSNEIVLIKSYFSFNSKDTPMWFIVDQKIFSKSLTFVTCFDNSNFIHSYCLSVIGL